MLTPLFVPVLSLLSTDVHAARCTPDLLLTRPSNMDTAVLLPWNDSQTWAVSQRFDDNVGHAINFSIPYPEFWLTWMDSKSSNKGWIAAELYLLADFSNSTCSTVYTQPFNFTSSSEDFVIGEPTRIWWAGGTTQGNISVRVTTLGRTQRQDMDTLHQTFNNLLVSLGKLTSSAKMRRISILRQADKLMSKFHKPLL
ncbi:hypothetical protein FB45DRAFT_216329 [Roridomyces roridus]|uniref:Uncharacterized protein n=1 Tax=Roridomyces roridus TaxID=1738132 RepID=A0AAD7BDG0_9AGAR|nr:hypothetical protein FB45DRAFT_216329 [Roridomyces roridus]